MSGRLDSNQRPPEPHSGALAKLRHAPNVSASLRAIYGSHEKSFYTGGADFARVSDHFPTIPLPHPGWPKTPLTGTPVGIRSQSATFSAPAPVRPRSQRLGSGTAAQARQADKRAARRYDRLLRASGKGRRGVLRGAVGVSLPRRCMARLGVRTARATYISKGRKALGCRVAKGGPAGVSWHRGCAPLHTIFSTPPALPADRLTPGSSLPGRIVSK